ncbi:MAG: hypothetical protein ACLQVF_18505 [Isosphaeraceae bacterium]
MKRVFAMLAGLCLILVIGCSAYDSRLEQTLEELRYRKRLNDNLTDAPTKGKLQELAIFVRPPKALKGPTQTFGMTVVEPGKFDLEQSFIDQQKQESMHLLARVVRPKAPTKKGAAPQPEPTPRGKFVDDVLELVKSVYGVDVETAQLKSESHTHGNHTNTYKGKIVDLTAKKVQIYFYGDEKAPYQVALIFEYPEASHASINPKIPLCLEAFAVGEAARHAFQGAGEFDEEGGEGGGAPPPI